MRYRELKIETQRQTPARARTEGEALLRRAGYTGADGQLSPLGEAAQTQLEQLAQELGPADFFARLRMRVTATERGEYYQEIDTGRAEVIRCIACTYADARPNARFRKQEPASEPAARIERVQTPECHTIEALANFLGIDEVKTAKALMFTRPADDRFVFVVIRGDMQLSEAKLKTLVGEVRPATVSEITAAGAAPGYASPIGLKNALIVADDLIPVCANLVAGANEAGYHLMNTNFGRDYQAEVVADVALAGAGMPCPKCGNPLSMIKAELLAEPSRYCLDNVLEVLAELNRDERGLTFPVAAAPFEVYLLCLPGKELDTRTQAEQLYRNWQEAGVRVIFDDRDERAGVKFADADLIGCPVRATVGERAMKDGMVELKARKRGATMLVPLADALKTVQSLNKAS